MTRMNQPRLTWRKSSKSAVESCVEVAIDNQFVLIRNSKDPNGNVLKFAIEQWAAFLEDVKRDGFADSP